MKLPKNIIIRQYLSWYIRRKNFNNVLNTALLQNVLFSHKNKSRGIFKKHVRI